MTSYLILSYHFPFLFCNLFVIRIKDSWCCAYVHPYLWNLTNQTFTNYEFGHFFLGEMEVEA